MNDKLSIDEIEVKNHLIKLMYDNLQLNRESLYNKQGIGLYFAIEEKDKQLD